MTGELLIVEDEPELAMVLADYARAAGYVPRVMVDGDQAMAYLREHRPALVVLDLMLPGLDGMSLCRQLRAFSDVPVIMVTARVEEIDRLIGLESGADDYVCKPFSPRELMARVAAVLRRQQPMAVAASIVSVDEASRTARVRGRSLALTPTEYCLFAAMLARPGTIFSRAKLMDLAGRDNLNASDRSIDTHMKNLRRKLAELVPEEDLLHAVYGCGYRLDMPRAASTWESP
jgi:two-component system response regulator BaeR